MNRSGQKALRQEGSFLSWCLFGSAAVICWLIGLDQAAPWLPFLLSVGLIGLSHGAADWLLLRPTSKRDGLRKFLLYSLTGLVTACLAWISILAVLAGFFVISVLHFGMGDERDLRSFGTGRPASPVVRVSGISRMAIFFTLVCLSDPGSVVGLFDRVGRLLGEAEALPILPGQLEKVALAGLVAGSIGWGLSLFIQGRERFRRPPGSPIDRRLEIEGIEGVVLFLAAVLLDAVFAVGLYFLCWHALRHSVLLTGKLNDIVSPGSGLWKKLLTLPLKSWPLFLPIIPVMFGLVWADGSLASPTSWVAALLVVCILFTLPHHFIVERQLNGVGKRLTGFGIGVPGHSRRSAATTRLNPKEKASVSRNLGKLNGGVP